MDNVVQSDGADAQKPCNYNWCKEEPYPVGPIMLEKK